MAVALFAGIWQATPFGVAQGFGVVAIEDAAGDVQVESPAGTQPGGPAVQNYDILGASLGEIAGDQIDLQISLDRAEGRAESAFGHFSFGGLNTGFTMSAQYAVVKAVSSSVPPRIPRAGLAGNS